MAACALSRATYPPPTTTTWPDNLTAPARTSIRKRNADSTPGNSSPSIDAFASASRSQSKYYGIITLRQIIQCLLIHDTLAIMKDNASLFHDADSLIQHGVGEFPNGQDIP